MSDEPRERPWTLWIIGLLLMPVLYVASTGPFVWIQDHLPAAFYTPLEEAAEFVYFPLIWLSDKNDTMFEAIEWYVGLWQ